MKRDIQRREYISPYGSKTWEYFAIFTCTLLILCLGIMIGWISPIVVLLILPNSPIHVTKLEISTLTVALPAGRIVATLINMLVIDKIGRKYMISLSSLPLVAAWSIILMTRNISMWYVARFLSGISVGLGFIVVPIYLGEISSVKTRGANGAMVSIMCSLGILMSFIIVPCVSITITTSIFLVMSICFVVLFSFMPESPYYLLMRGRTEKGEEMLQKLRGKIDVSEELTTIEEFLKEKDDKKVKLWTTLKAVFMIRRHRRAFFIIFLLTLNNYFSSFYPLLVYGQLIFKEIASKTSDYTINIVAGSMLLLSSIVTVFFVDKIGRKLLILVSGIIVGLCNFTISSYFYTKDVFNIDVSSYYLIPIIASISSIFFCNLGFSSILPIMMSEVFAIEVKMFSSCIFGIIAGILTMINGKLYILLAISLNYGHGLPFLGFCALVWLTTALLYYLSPETKGKTFIEIQRQLQN